MTRDVGDLIFCPLDLPAPPQIDRTAVLEWLDEYEAEGLVNSENYIRKTMEDHFKRSYPWRSAYMYDYRVRASNSWTLDFDKRFPEFAEYVKSFPHTTLYSAMFLFQKEQTEVWLHNDPDPWWGFRTYLWNDFEDGKLYFRKTKERYDRKLNTRTDSHLLEDEKHHVYLPRKEWIPFMLNSQRAMHGIEPGGAGQERMCLLMIGAYDEAKARELLQRSAEKYAEYCLWW